MEPRIVEGTAFGDISWTITYTGPREIERGSIERLLTEIETDISSWIPSSALMSLNSTGVLPQGRVHFDTILQHAFDMYEYTQGFFDPSLYPLMVKYNIVPSLTNRVVQPGMKNWPNVQLDFGGIGKGYTVDCMFEHVMNSGADRCTVYFGGDIRTSGPIRVNGGDIVDNGAIATSVKSRDILAKKPGYPDDIVSVWAPTCVQADAIATATLAGFF